MANWSQYKTTLSSSTSVATSLDNSRKALIKMNRHYMSSVIDSIMFCATQEIALRGHRETESSRKQGNFLATLHLIAKHDAVINDRIKDGPRNAQYTSHSIQNEILHLLANKVRSGICEDIRAAGYFSILADETKDSAKQEQMCFVIRYADMAKGAIHEHFISFVEAKSLDANSLSSYIIKLLHDLDLNLSKIVSQGYDGASVMSGRCNGVQAKIREVAPNAVYIHCFAHVLNLVLVDATKSLPIAAEFFALLESLYVFISSSKAHTIFIEKQKTLHPNKQPRELKKLSDTRWACRHDAVNAICNAYDSLILALEEISERDDYSKAVEAKGLLHQIKIFSFVITLITFDKILSLTKHLSDQLQSSTIDLYQASQLVSATKSMLMEYRTDNYWDKIYKYATDLANLHSIIIQTISRKRKRPGYLESSLITSTVGSRPNQSSKEDYKCQLYFPVLDTFLKEMDERFDETHQVILMGIGSCSPSSSIFLSIPDMKPFAFSYGIDVTSLDIEIALTKRSLTLDTSQASITEFASYLYSCQPAFKTLFEIVQVALTISITSAECERSFSSLKRIKTNLRSTMGEERLSDLAILSIESDSVSKYLCEHDHKSIIDQFAAVDKNRRIVLS